MTELTYRQRLAVVWLLLWRTGLATVFAVFALLSLVDAVTTVLAIQGNTNGYKTIIALSAYPISLFLIAPFVVSTVVRKNFNGFRLQISQDEAPAQRDQGNQST